MWSEIVFIFHSFAFLIFPFQCMLFFIIVIRKDHTISNSVLPLLVITSYLFIQVPLIVSCAKHTEQIREFFFTSAFPKCSWEIIIGHFQLHSSNWHSLRDSFMKFSTNFTESETDSYVAKTFSISSLIKNKLDSPFSILKGIYVLISSYSISTQ